MTTAILVVEITALIAAAMQAAFCIEFHRRTLDSKRGRIMSKHTPEDLVSLAESEMRESGEFNIDAELAEACAAIAKAAGAKL